MKNFKGVLSGIPFFINTGMGNKIPRKPEPINIRGICVLCGKNKQHSKGGGIYRATCQICHKKRYVIGDKYAQRKLKGDVCDKCGFVPEHLCQLDVDHIDGDHKNNSPENLQTLCANCHRLKTFLNEDWN